MHTYVCGNGSDVVAVRSAVDREAEDASREQKLRENGDLHLYTTIGHVVDTLINSQGLMACLSHLIRLPGCMATAGPQFQCSCRTRACSSTIRINVLRVSSNA